MTVASAAARAQDSFLPGYWETTDRSPVGVKTERRCIMPQDVAKFIRGPSNHIYACTYPRESVGQGQISFRGECVDKKGRRYPLSGKGEYTHTTLTISADVTVRLLGIPLTLSASTDAHRLGDTCPALGK
ncbi:MAG: DUF3617 domain-containing protein [Pseudomonadota bacterium]|nr:DUF3617 domain-containing protein [Pseudomonadota bacterium]